MERVNVMLVSFQVSTGLFKHQPPHLGQYSQATTFGDCISLSWESALDLGRANARKELSLALLDWVAEVIAWENCSHSGRCDSACAAAVVLNVIVQSRIGVRFRVCRVGDPLWLYIMTALFCCAVRAGTVNSKLQFSSALLIRNTARLAHRQSLRTEPYRCGQRWLEHGAAVELQLNAL